MPHLTPELYLMVLDGSLPPRALARALHEHLVASCDTCRKDWQAARSAAPTLAGSPPAEPPWPQGKPSAFSPAARTLEAQVRQVRSTRKEAQIDLWRLLRLPPDRREDRIVNARTRFRSRAFAELLVEHCRTLVRAKPRDAAELLELVPLCLLWTPGAPGAVWALELQMRADAHLANALRVSGDLGAADALFADLRRRLASAPDVKAELFGEVASLEASLRWDQRRFEAARELLDQAVLIYQDRGQREELARVLIKRASIHQNTEQFDAALADLERARRLLDRREHAFLYLFTVVGAVPVLLDLERYDDAEAVLADAEETFEEAAEPWWALRLRGLLGRAALGQGDLDRARLLLREARDGYLAQGLPQDTANASLDLALVYLHQGRTAEVRLLCREIAETLRSLGVERDALAALSLLYKATAADAAALAQVSVLRRQLERKRPPEACPGEPG